MIVAHRTGGKVIQMQFFKDEYIGIFKTNKFHYAKIDCASSWYATHPNNKFVGPYELVRWNDD